MKLIWKLLLLLASCAILVYTRQHGAVDFGTFDRLLSTVKSTIEIPSGRNILTADSFSNFFMGLTKMFIPASEAFSSALKIKLEDDKLETLLNCTNGIVSIVKHIGRQQEYYAKASGLKDQWKGFNQSVKEPLKVLTFQIEMIAAGQMNATDKELQSFADSCLQATSPVHVATYLQEMVEICGRPVINATVITWLYDVLDSFSFQEEQLSKTDERLFYRNIAVIYATLEKLDDGRQALSAFLYKRDGRMVEKNKLVASKAIKIDLGIKHDNVEIECLPKASMLQDGYKRRSLDSFRQILVNYVVALGYVTTTCANVTYSNNPLKADVFTQKVFAALKPVNLFIESWFERLLSGTWKSLETRLIESIIRRKPDHGEDNVTYAALAKTIREEMEMIGSENYRRQYIITKEKRNIDYRNEVHYDTSTLGDPDFAIITASSVSCFVLRIRRNSTEFVESLGNMTRFHNDNLELFHQAMNKDLYFQYSPILCIDGLKKRGLDFEAFKNHSSYILFRSSTYNTGFCEMPFAIESDCDYDNCFVQTMRYYYEGSILFQRCYDWLLVLGL